MQNVEATIQKQFANSPILVGLIYKMNAFLDQATNFNAFYTNIWDIMSATGYGLDLWGRIVGVQRVLKIAAVTYLGASGPNGPSGDSMNVAPFYSGEAVTSNYALSDQAFLTLILAKALANISNGSIQSINQILMNLFGASGQCWCTDGLNMTMTYTFDFALSPVQSAIVFQSGVLPRPPGVSVTVVQLGAGLTSDSGALALTTPPAGYPTSSSGLSTGAIWSNGGVVCVAGTTTPSGSAAAVYFNNLTAATLLALGGGNLPLTNPGAGSGQLWNNGGVVCVA